ncbi:STAS domain-containing protein [Fuscibacter oryzae]|uniref:STAS domain-containing protein n=1 Tax=Fuscibacter oryzae TaxID=2803939 RepID=A0A8J7SUJ6_9RHOB|nr:STAS domain-containing protein [Fuscibacter oryzae]MBL4926829.1 STAS domain-containing protein [Fuscibacter oryzae]
MDITVEKQGNLLLARVAQDRIDAACAIQFKDRMREISLEGQGRVVLDLSQVTFIDSSGLGAVVAVRKALGGERPLELLGLTPTVQKVFRLTRMDSIFTLHDRWDDGLQDAV